MYSGTIANRNHIPFALQFGTNGEYDINLNFHFQVDTPTEQSYVHGEIGPTRFCGMRPGESYYFFQSNLQQQQVYGQRTPAVIHPSSSSRVIQSTSNSTQFFSKEPSQPTAYSSKQRDSGYLTPLNNENLSVQKDSRRSDFNSNDFDSGIRSSNSSMSYSSFSQGPLMTSTPYNSRSPSFGNGQLQAPYNRYDTLAYPPLPTPEEHYSFEHAASTSSLGTTASQNTYRGGCNLM